MFRIKANQNKINNLQNKIENLGVTIHGGLLGDGLKGEINYLKRENQDQQKTIGRLNERLSVLEQIVREAGLVTDLDSKDVKIREDRTFSLFGDARTDKIAYKINKVVTKK